MTRAVGFRQGDVERLVRAAVAGGLDVQAVEIGTDGAIRVLTRRFAPTAGGPHNGKKSNENRMVPGGGFEPPTRGFSSGAFVQ